jgi:succinate-acetate transporter protein
MIEKVYIHNKGWGIVLAFALLFLSLASMAIIGILQTNDIITKVQGEYGLILSFLSFFGSMYCLIA